MLTAHIQRSCVPLPPELFSQLCLHDGGEASVSWDGRSVLVSAGPGVNVRKDRIPLSRNILDLAGLKDGDVVSLELMDEKVAMRRVENLSEFPNEGHDEHGIAIPPGWLRQRSVGHVNASSFIKSSHTFAAQLRDTVRGYETNIAQAERILDFGCGCGRLIRALPLVTSAHLYGCDSDKHAAMWCRSHLLGEFYQNSEFPPLPWRDGNFDMIYAISVLTHMDETHQNVWLVEWRRILKPGGLLLASFRRPQTMSEKEATERSGGIYSTQTGYHSGLFPAYYRTGLHTLAYVRSHWSQYFEIADIIERGKFLSQEVVIMKKAG